MRRSRFKTRLADAGDKIEAELGFRPQLRISLTTGPVVLGAVDSGESTSVTAHGDIVNLAARLQVEAAPGTVVMSEAMLRQVEGMVETEPAGVFRFKGKSEPAAGLSSRRGSRSRDAIRRRGGAGADFLYRPDQRSWLSWKSNCSTSIPFASSMSSEIPGIGKSRLLYEFALRHSADRVVMLRGNCSADGQGNAIPAVHRSACETGSR